MKKSTPYFPWEVMDTIHLNSDHYHPNTMTWWVTMDTLNDGHIFTVNKAGNSLRYINNQVVHDNQMKWVHIFGHEFKCMKSNEGFQVRFGTVANEYHGSFLDQYKIIWIHEWIVPPGLNRLLICE